MGSSGCWRAWKRGRVRRSPIKATHNSAPSVCASRAAHLGLVSCARPSRSSATSPDRTSASPPMRGASRNEAESSVMPRSSAQHSPRIPQRIGEAFCTYCTTREGGFELAPAGFSTPTIMYVSITGMPRASAESAVGVSAPTARPRPAQHAAESESIPTSDMHGSLRFTRQWSSAPKPAASAEMTRTRRGPRGYNRGGGQWLGSAMEDMQGRCSQN
jgi:hypothetical protein